ncbi:MAG: cytochrome b/b6 domain-containing protein [Burkholderiaceae bacterium]
MAAASITSFAPPSYLYYRHTLPVRIMHWTNFFALTVLFMSGLHIFNAHAALYWGDSSYSERPPLLQIGARETATGEAVGVTTLFGRQFDTTGVLGLSTYPNGEPNRHAFPTWVTIPGPYSLALARDWHFFFAWIFALNGVAYVLYSLFSRHLMRDLAPTGKELRGIGASIAEHVKFRHPTGEAAKRYNVLQKLAYLSVIFVLLPLVILAGWAMSPWLNSIFPGWVDLLGGRQSARTIHFIVAWLLFLFLAVHVFEVLISGFWNHMRSMITGRYRIKTEA